MLSPEKYVYILYFGQDTSFHAFRYVRASYVYVQWFHTFCIIQQQINAAQNTEWRV